MFEMVAVADKKSGEVEELDAGADQFIGIWVADTPAGEVGVVDTDGIWEVPKTTGSDTFSAGDPVALAVASGEATVAASATGTHRAAAQTGATTTKLLVAINTR